MSDPLPKGWSSKESRSRPGKWYYINDYSNETVWERPMLPAAAKRQAESDPNPNKRAHKVPEEREEVQVLHLLKKHVDSRRPSSWRQKVIVRSEDEAREEVEGMRAAILDAAEREEKFRALASVESDCSSAQKGGDLGSFGRDKMQKKFEEASFALKIGEVSDLVSTDSGIHVILRLK